MHYTSKEVYEFISKTTNDPIVERKTCEVSGQEFPIYKSDLEFYDKISPIFNGKKYQIPTPRLCPEERERRRLLFRNDRKLYKRKCDATGENIISIYSEDKPYIIYSTKEWRGDKRDAIDYGLDISFNKSFNTVFYKLFMTVPQISIMNDNDVGSENCAYCQDFALGKNCYFAFETGEIEDSMYCHHCNTAKSVVDCEQVISHSSFCYECISSSNLYNCKYLQDSINCNDCIFGHSLKGCSDCFACVNLSNKQYYIFNKQYTKEEYEQKIKGITNSIEKTKIIKDKFDNFVKQNIKLSSFIKNSEGSYGDFIHNCKNILGFWSFNCEDSKYIINSDRLKNCYDFQAWKAEYCLEGVTSDNSYHTCFTTWCWKCENTFYSHNCHSCKNIFGCVGLKNKQYCIFNKQYTKKEYENLVPKIISQMQKTGERGEFFDPRFSPFGYNETVAQDFFPLNKESTTEKGLKRQNYSYDRIVPEGMQVVKHTNYTDTQRSELIDNPEVLKKIFICEISGRPFRIIKQELEFYRKHNLPLPTKHPDIRNEERLKQRPTRELYLRNCDKCKKEILSVYNNYFEGKTYCQDCYQTEIYG